MKIRTIICVILLCLVAFSAYAQDEKITLKLQNEPIMSVLNKLFNSYEKSWTIDNNVQNGTINLNVTDKPFNTVLSLVLSQVNATYEYKDGIYMISPDYSKMNNNMRGGTNTPGGMGNNPMMGGANIPGGMGNNPMMGGAGNAMGGRNGMNGMNGNQNVPVADPTKRGIKKIKVKYNSPDQILSLMDGDSYADVVYNGSGSSSNSNSNNSNNNNNSNSNSSSNRSNNR